MTLYFCLDDRNGMLFNHRRQSRDAAVLEDIRSRLEGELVIDPISQRLMERVKDATIYPDILGSDHCPVGLELK